MAVKVQFDADVKQAVANIKHLNRTARDASRHAGSLSSRLGGVFSSLKGALGGLAAFTGFAVSIGTVKRAIDEMDNTAKQARGLNMTGEELQVLQYAAQSANLPLEAVTNVLPKLSKLTADAAAGSGEAAAKLARLGLTADDLAGKSGYEQLQLAARAINSIGDHSERTAVAMDVFGKSGAKLLDMLSGLDQAAANLRAQGGIITDDQLKAAEEFNQALTNIQRNITAGLMNSGFVGWLADVAEGFDAWASNSKRMQSAGVFDRQTAVREVVGNAVASGRISKEHGDELLAGESWSWGDIAQAAVNPAAAAGIALDKRRRRAANASELDALLREGGFGDIAGGAASQTRKQSAAETRAEVERAQAAKTAREEEARKREEVRKQAAEAEADRRATEETMRFGEAFARQVEQLDRQLADLGKINNGPRTRDQYVQEQIDRARKAAPEAFDAERQAAIAQAAGAAYDRGEAEDKARKEAADLRDQLRAPGQEAMDYRGDAVSRIGGTLGGSGFDRVQQSQLTVAEHQLAAAQSILQKLDTLKIQYPQLFK